MHETVQKFKVENSLEIRNSFNSVAHSRNYYEHQWGGVVIWNLFIYFFFFVIVAMGPTQSAVLCILGVFPWG